MRLYYIVLMWQDGSHLKGTGEKVFEDANGEVREYKGIDRVEIELSGYVGKRFLSRDHVIIHITEYGRDQHGNERKSSAVHACEDSSWRRDEWTWCDHGRQSAAKSL